MADIEITQKEIEDKLFNFIEENFGKKRHECFNEVVNFVEYEIISILSSNDDIADLEIENEELENSVEELKNAFDSLKDNCCDRLKEIESNLEDIIENNELDSTIDKLKELKGDVEHQRFIINDADVDDFN